MDIRNSAEKNALLLKERGIGFDSVKQAIEKGDVFAVNNHTNIPSRKYTKKYLKHS